MGMGSFQLLIIPILWAVLLGIMLYFRFRDQEDLNPPSTERRRQDRREYSSKAKKRRAAEKFDGEDHRSNEDRRQPHAWHADYHTLKEKLEKDSPVEP